MGHMAHHVLAILNQPSAAEPPHVVGAAPFAFVDPTTPQLSVLDLGATRGDGVFETISVGEGRAHALEHHLRRFVASAEKLELPGPDVDLWREAVFAAITALEPAVQSSVKTVLTRGVEGDGRPTGWVYAAHSADFTRARTEGVRVVTLDRGYRHDVETTSPWLLAGAKTLSYAVNRAAVREAHRRDADDVIFVSSDGFLLEGATSSLVYRVGDRLLTTGGGHGTLDGTTQANVFAYAQSLSLSTGFELAGPDRLRGADAAWLVSSVRLAAPVRELDGKPFAVDHEFTAGLNAYLLALRD